MIKQKLSRNAKKVDKFLINFIKKQKNSLLVKPMKYGVISGGKKIRSTIIFDMGRIFNLKEKNLINICAAVECIHSYSLIHDDLPCMDNDSIRRGKPATHIKYGEASAVLAGSSLLTLAFEIIVDKSCLLNSRVKNEIIIAVPKLKNMPHPAEWIVKGHLPHAVIPNAAPILSVQVTAINPAISPKVIPVLVNQGQKHMAIKAGHIWNP